MKDGLERALDEKTIADRLKELEEKDKKNNKEGAVEEKTVEKRIKILTVSASEYAKNMHSWAEDDRYLSEYDMVGVVNKPDKGLYYCGFLSVGPNWEFCPEGTEAVVDIKRTEDNKSYFFYGTAMIPKKE